MTNFKRYFFLSVLLHIVILTALIASFDFHGRMPVLKNSDKDMQIINAAIVDAPLGPELPPKVIPQPQPAPPQKIEAPLPQPKPMEKQPVIAVKPPQPPVVPIPQPKPVIAAKAPAPQKILAPLPKPKSVEKQPVIAIKPKPIAVPNQRKKQANLFEKQLLDDLKTNADQQKKIKHQQLERAFEKEMKTQAAKALQQELMQEKNQLALVQSQKVQGEVNKYKALILQAISYHWLVPPGMNKKLTCELLIRTAPGGLVIDAQVVKSSGDLALDRSARAAVFKASPLPVPSDTAAFEAFRQFILKVRPENVS